MRLRLGGLPDCYPRPKANSMTGALCAETPE